MFWLEQLIPPDLPRARCQGEAVGGDGTCAVDVFPNCQETMFAGLDGAKNALSKPLSASCRHCSPVSAQAGQKSKQTMILHKAPGA